MAISINTKISFLQAREPRVKIETKKLGAKIEGLKEGYNYTFTVGA